MRSVRNERFVTLDEYLAREAKSETRNEYVDGFVYPMADTTFEHGVIIGNLHFGLVPAARRRGCQALTAGIKVQVEAANAVYYPDLVVTWAGQPPKTVILREPVLVIEVLSPDTETMDRREKLRHYKLVPSIAEIVLVSQDVWQVETHRRTGATWEIEIVEASGSVELLSLDLVVGLEEIYRL